VENRRCKVVPHKKTVGGAERGKKTFLISFKENEQKDRVLSWQCGIGKEELRTGLPSHAGIRAREGADRSQSTENCPVKR